jgi:anti-sigma factor RsiW
MSEVDHDPEWSSLLSGFVDDELDAAHALRVERHVAACPACAEELAGLVALSGRLRQGGVAFPLPDDLGRRVAAAIDREARRGRGLGTSLLAAIREMVAGPGRWSLVPSLGVLAVALALVVGRPPALPGPDQELVAGHVRSLLADHLVDVATSSQHVVKPWFNGRIDFSPPVVDLADRGFPLVGGRVDYVGGKVVAALVYRRNGHVINLFVRPEAPSAARVSALDGYTVEHWTEGGLGFSAVSDVNPEDLQRFETLFRATAATPER